ncbi:MAG: UTP--glucose-1-phosphate uridylyltransferase, partial [Limisphaerales bacterium]
MASKLAQLITSPDPAVRNQSLDAICRAASLPELLTECAELEAFRHRSENLYERVRALLFLYAIHRFHLPLKPAVHARTLISFSGYTHLLQRRFEEAVATFLKAQAADGPSDPISSALAVAYYRLALQTLADQVRRSVRSVRGNQWMFRMGHPADHPLRIRPELLKRSDEDGTYPILRERTPVRMDLTHCGWSDIFFLGMDYPEGAKVLNISIDLGVHGRDSVTRPPVETYLRVLDEPLLRLTSVDLGATADITHLADVFDFAKDYLGLLKAAVIAGGIVPPGVEGSGQSLADLLARVVGPGRGLELVSAVNGIPKGSRLAVSTNLLASMIALCMRATGQASSLHGSLQEDERRLVLARAILGEWLGGSGGGWQDSGGVWPGMKTIMGVTASGGDPEFGASRGCLLPHHHVLTHEEVSPQTREALQNSLVLVHGGMAQDVGPILEMVTEKYLLRSEAEWQGRQQAIRTFDDILDLLKRNDIRSIGAATERNFFGPIQTIIPWAGNSYTESLIRSIRAEFADDFYGFWMLGGMAGGGMGFIFHPRIRAAAQDRLHAIMRQTKRRLERAVPFAIDPVVYDFSINERGTWAGLLQAGDALMPPEYYTQLVPRLLKTEMRLLPDSRRTELEFFSAACRKSPKMTGTVQAMFDVLLPRRADDEIRETLTLEQSLGQLGFDRVQHEQIRTDLRNSRIGLAQNRFPPNTDIRDVEPGDVWHAQPGNHTATGLQALREGRVAVVSLAGGAGSRWTHGAGVVKALNPFAKFAGAHRNFIEVHLAKSRRTASLCGTSLPHVITTSYLTHDAIADWLALENREGPLLLSEGRSVGLRLIPMARDLVFAWQETPQQVLDEQKQKVRESLHAALIAWARHAGEGADYIDNLPLQCLHPTGHWYEVPNMLRNGVLAGLLQSHPALRYLMVHNIDTLGADVDPSLLGWFIEQDSAMMFEVIARQFDDRGGGLARVNGRPRLVEGLAL